ncbi:uncharacterized protein LOC126966546 [Leptidea sinapis]|uniref:uncharacterized protein LOC126966546 n=1 Tax=Leptidea sinapis TaxID=189913 RepID=UPI0021280045|nr:uncharacterized protein LOC126966546 [Leptidea sinapis]
MSTAERKFLVEFIKLYESMECLWDKNHPRYRDRDEKMSAYQILLKKYKEFEMGATLVEMKKKLDNMRTACTREVKKVLKAKAFGGTHLPILWYYDHMQFLYKDLLPLECRSTYKQSNTSVDTDHIYEETSTSCISSEPENEEPVEKKRKSILSIFLQNNDEDLHKVNESLNASEAQDLDDNEDQECELMGRMTGIQLKSLVKRQRMIALKLISDVIFYAKLDQLTAESSIKLD